MICDLKNGTVLFFLPLSLKSDKSNMTYSKAIRKTRYCFLLLSSNPGP